MGRRGAVCVLVVAIAVAGGCNSDADEVPTMPTVEGADGVEFLTGPNTPVRVEQLNAGAELPLPFSWRSTEYNAWFTNFGESRLPTTSSPCSPTEAARRRVIAVRVVDQGGGDYGGPITIKLRTQNNAVRAFLSSGSECGTTLRFQRWPGGSIYGTAGIGAEQAEPRVTVSIDVEGTDPEPIQFEF